jgi:hypothetical protein
VAADDWHSDCLFNYFKEYMFLKMYGASYSDAFYSNQIRYGLMTRDEALNKLNDGRRHYAEEMHDVMRKLGLKNNGDVDVGVFLECMAR